MLGGISSWAHPIKHTRYFECVARSINHAQNKPCNMVKNRTAYSYQWQIQHLAGTEC